MALQFQVPNYQQTPLPDIRNALSPISEGIDTYRQGMDAQFKGQMETKRLGMDQRRLQMAEEDQKFQREDRLIKHMGSMAQVIRDDPDQARAAANWQKLHSSMPTLSAKLQEFGIDPRDHKSGAQLIAAQAGMYVNPLDEQAKRANVAHAVGSESRAAAMAPYQLQEAKIGAELKQRELDQPKGSFQHMKNDEQLFHLDPRTGKATRIAGGEQNAQLGPYKDMKQKVDVEEGLRKEVTTAAKDYQTISQASTSIQAISKAPSAASDIAMVFSFMKILDPGSVVRETEYATAARAAGVPDRIVGIIEKIQSGKFLTPDQRADFLSVAGTLAKSQETGYRANLERYRDISNRIGVDPRNVIPPTGGVPTSPPARPGVASNDTAAAPAPPGPPRAHNPQTGQVIEWNGQAWVPVQ